jgi:hypothetical protein
MTNTRRYLKPKKKARHSIGNIAGLEYTDLTMILCDPFYIEFIWFSLRLLRTVLCWCKTSLISPKYETTVTHPRLISLNISSFFHLIILFAGYAYNTTVGETTRVTGTTGLTCKLQFANVGNGRPYAVTHR